MPLSRFLRSLLCVVVSVAAACAASKDPVSTNAPVVRTNASSTSTAAPRAATNDIITRIRHEGLNRSQITNTLVQLTEVIGPRLTASPNYKRAAEWTRSQLEQWGLTNAQLEAWGPFGRGWSLERYSAQVVSPHTFPLIGHPFAWSPGLSNPVTADVVFLDAKTEAELNQYRGKLTGVVALVSTPREVKARTEPDVYRLTDANLLQLANMGKGSAPFFRSAIPPTNAVAPRAEVTPQRPSGGQAGTNVSSSPRTNTPASPSIATQNRLTFAHREGAVAVMSSGRAEGGNFIVESASVPTPPRSTNASARFTSSRPWATNASSLPPQIQLLAEDYNRMVRMLQRGEKLRVHLDLKVKFHDEDLMGYNVVAEIPGTDRKDEVVMLGGHLDSWHSGTGATDNAAGVAVAMEAMRILKAVGAKPRRTVRIALWGGEEQGLFGSEAYVRRHFGYYTNITNGAGSAVARSPREHRESGPAPVSTNRTSRTRRELVRQRDYEKFSAYYNLDNGSGRIRGVYLQGNEAVRPLFRKWLEPFRDLGAETLTLGNTGATDHMSFDNVGLPGFQFIQDPVEYWSRTHHSNLDVYDRLQIEELKQASSIMAAFVYETAMLDEKLPRKPLPLP